ncbi:MAG: DUF1071 domain-containing protein [Waterburya sp.]
MHLTISAEAYEANYNYNIIPYIDSDFSGNDILPWAIAYRLLRKFHPTFEAVTTSVEHIKYDNEGNPEATMIYSAIRDNATGLMSNSYQFPVMSKGGQRKSAKDVDSRELSDAIMRSHVKTIASFTGLGLRLWTREGIDLNKKSKAVHDHPIYLTLIKVQEAKTAYLNINAELPENWIEPDFGMGVAKLREYRWLKEQPTITVPKQSELWQNWKSIKDGVAWATTTLGIADEEVKRILKEDLADVKEGKAEAFFNLLTKES